jgi:hypothetical protein
MKAMQHVFNTWFISILVATLIVFVCNQLQYASASLDEGLFPFLFPVLFYVLVAAAPSFFISWAFLALIEKSSYLSYEKLFLWFLAAILSVVLNVSIPVLIFTREIFSTELFFLFWPAYVAVVITIILRLKHFFSFLNKTTHHETSMV